MTVSVNIDGSDGEWEEIGTVSGIVFDRIPDSELIEPRTNAYSLPYTPPTVSAASEQRISFRRDLTAAMTRVFRVFPNAIGDVLYRELLSYLDVGSIFDKRPEVINRAIVHILEAPLAPEDEYQAYMARREEKRVF